MKATIAAAIAACLLPLPVAAQWAPYAAPNPYGPRPAAYPVYPSRPPVTVESVTFGGVRHTTIQSGGSLYRCYGVNLGGIDHTRCN